MAHVYKRGRQFWISYYVSGDLVQKSLRTTNEKIGSVLGLCVCPGIWRSPG